VELWTVKTGNSNYQAEDCEPGVVAAMLRRTAVVIQR